MFEDDPAAEEADKHGVVYKTETIVQSHVAMAEIFRSTTETKARWSRQKHQRHKEKRRLAAMSG